MYLLQVLFSHTLIHKGNPTEIEYLIEAEVKSFDQSEAEILWETSQKPNIIIHVSVVKFQISMSSHNIYATASLVSTNLFWKIIKRLLLQWRVLLKIVCT